MTCIVGVEHGGQVFIGGDSAACDGYDRSIQAAGKVFKNGPLVIGYTSSFRMGQLLEYELKPPTHERGLGDLAYLVTMLVPALRKCFSDGGYLHKSNEQESGGKFLLGYRGKLYFVEENFHVMRSASGYNACGCGAAFAFGSLHTTRDVKNPKARVLTALKAAAHCSAGVSAPFHVVKL